MKLPIPKRIIQTGNSRDMSALSRAAIANVTLLNPDFEHLFFDDRQVEDFVHDRFPELAATFEAFPVRIQRYDFFRYLAVYDLGGFYFDLDVFLAEALGGLLDCGCVFPFEALTINRALREEYGMDFEIGNYGFGAAPRHPFLLAIIENCIRAQKDADWAKRLVNAIPLPFRGDFRVLCTTGPGLVSRTLAEYPYAAEQVKVLFPDDVCDRAHWCCFGDYGVHLLEGRWRKRRNVVMRHLTAWWIRREQQRAIEKGRERDRTRSLKPATHPFA